MEKKITRVEKFEAIKAMVKGFEGNVQIGDKVVSANDILAFADENIGRINKKNQKVQDERAKVGDAIREKVFAVLSEKNQNADEITALIGDAEITRSKVVNRLATLIKDGFVTKEVVKVDKRKVTVYRIADVNSDEE